MVRVIYTENNSHALRIIYISRVTHTKNYLHGESNSHWELFTYTENNLHTLRIIYISRVTHTRELITWWE
jgi:hypothetical protein